MLMTDRYTFGMPTPTYQGSVRQSPGTGTQPATDRFVYELPPRTRTRPGFDRVRNDWPDMPNSVPSHDKLSPKAEVHASDRSPEADLMETVAHLQLKVEALKFVQSAPPALAKRTLPVLSKPVAFTSTKVPRFSGGTSWDQYRQVFDAIVRSHGWDDKRVTLQLLSQLEGDALNVALLVPEVKRATRVGLVGALTEHYGSPGRLAVSWRQFERKTCQEGEDPSTFAITLETLIQYMDRLTESPGL